MGQRIIGSTVIDFSPPAHNLNAPLFKTFRLGVAYSKRLRPDQRVYLLARKNMQIVGAACVMAVEVGDFLEMTYKHAFLAHNWLGHPDPIEALRESMRKRYGPNKISDDSLVTVITLEVTKSL